jgi:hypothetical protein
MHTLNQLQDNAAHLQVYIIQVSDIRWVAVLLTHAPLDMPWKVERVHDNPAVLDDGALCRRDVLDIEPAKQTNKVLP